jgi:hypothetical protein
MASTETNGSLSSGGTRTDVSTARREDAAAEPRPRQRTKGLGTRSERALRAVIEAVFARRGEGDALIAPPKARVSWVYQEFDDFLARASLRSYAIVLGSIWLVSLMAPVLLRRFSSLSALSLSERVRGLEAVEASGFAPALLAVKALLSLHYYEHPDAAREVGFDGACLLSSQRQS